MTHWQCGHLMLSFCADPWLGLTLTCRVVEQPGHANEYAYESSAGAAGLADLHHGVLSAGFGAWPALAAAACCAAACAGVERHEYGDVLFDHLAFL